MNESQKKKKKRGQGSKMLECLRGAGTFNTLMLQSRCFQLLHGGESLNKLFEVSLSLNRSYRSVLEVPNGRPCAAGTPGGFPGVWHGEVSEGADVGVERGE